MRFFSLGKAMLSEGMDFFNYRAKATDSKAKRLLLPCVLAVIVMASAGYSASVLIEPLLASGQAAIVPMLLIILLSVVGLLEGIYKVQSLLFDCRDNDLLFALPIPKSRIFAMRVAKLLIFQIIFNALFMLPAFGVYAVLAQPGPSFYLFSVLMLFLTPLLPTAIAVVIGYIVKALSFGFRHTKISQTILTFVALIAMMLVFGNWEGIVVFFSDHAATISEMLGRIYYPAGAYARLVDTFSWGDFIGLLASSILPLVAIIYLCSFGYFKLISRNVATSTVKTSIVAKKQLKASSQTTALIKKELSRIAASPVFMVNTLFGPVLLLFITILAGVSMDGLVGFFNSGGEEATFSLDDLTLIAPLFYFGALVLMCMMTSITSSMISLEGKSLNVTKSLPVSAQQILRAKLLTSLVLAAPIFLLSDLCFILAFHPTLLDAILILVLSFLALTLSGLIGLLINLKYPKLDAPSDAEVVKQSMSATIAVFVGMGTGIGSVAILVAIAIFTPLSAPLILVGLYALIDLLLLKLLATKGAQKFNQITV